MKMRWGIVVEWDVLGLTCCVWAHHPMGTLALHFCDEESAQEYIDEALELPDDLDMIATPRQFT